MRNKVRASAQRHQPIQNSFQASLVSQSTFEGNGNEVAEERKRERGRGGRGGGGGGGRGDDISISAVIEDKPICRKWKNSACVCLCLCEREKRKRECVRA